MSLNYNEIFKIHILNNNNIEKIIVFIGNKENQENIELSNIFTKKELDSIYEDKIPIEYVDEYIYSDNTIDTLKKKLIKLHSSLLFEEIYLFSNTQFIFNTLSVFQELSQDTKKNITQEDLLIYLTNLGQNQKIKKLPVENIINYQNILQLNLNDKELIRNIPLDLKYSSVYYNYNFIVNPYLLEKTDQILFSNTDSLVSTLNSNIILNNPNIHNNNIYLVRARDILEHAEKQGIPVEYIINVYYPYLKKEKITNITDLNKKYSTLETANKKLLKNFHKLEENIELYYNLSKESNNLNYISTGITEVHLIIHPIYNVNFHLEDFFKGLHATKEIPLIKLNPGSKQEKLIRLYSEEKTIKNESIPTLPTGTILKNIKQLAKTKKISFYIDFSFTNEDLTIQNSFHINLYSNGDIEVKFSSPFSIKEEQMLFILNKYVNSIVTDFNNFYNSTGINLKKIHQLNDSNIEYLNIDYSTTLNTEIKDQIQTIINCSSNIFSFSNIKTLNNIDLRFKKVAYYNEMDNIEAYIIEKLKQNYSDKEVIDLLILNFNLTNEEAQNRLIVFLNEINIQKNLFNNKKIKIKNNPGFPISIVFNSIKNIFEITVKNIDNINYLKTIPIYINSLFKLLSGKYNKYVSGSHINKLCKQTIKTVEIKEEIISEIEKPYSENKIPIDIIAQLNDTNDTNDDDDFLNMMAELNIDDNVDNIEEEITETTVKTQSGGKKEYGKDINNMSLSNPNPFFQKMKKLDPSLFLTKKIGNYNAYSRLCPSNVRRQPVILTDEEMDEINKVSPDSYKHAIHYGSNPDKKNWYICPRYWCMLNNMPLTEKDVKEGKCGGKIIPFGAKKIPNGHYIYEFAAPKEHVGNDNEYVQHYPGFVKENSHPDGLCVPCCFKSWDTTEQINRRKKCLENKSIEDDKKDDDYIINPEKFPIPDNRWGFLPLTIQYFLNFDTQKCYISKTNNNIKKGVTCLLRRGTINKPNLSFLSAINNILNPIQNTEPLDSLRQKIVSITDLSTFLTLQHGTLVDIFANINMNETPKFYEKIIKQYKNQIPKVFSMDNINQVKLLAKNINALINFQNFILNEDNLVDYTYLWDIITTPGRLFKKGVNLVILDIPEDDITNKVDLICPTNHYANSLYDLNKDSIILIKKQNNYEVVMSYKLTNNDELIINKTFSINTNELKEIYPILNQLTNLFQECLPLNSLPNTYKVKQNLGLVELLKKINDLDYVVESQQINYNNLVYGINIREKTKKKLFYLPVKPSLPLVDIQLIFIEETKYQNYFDSFEFLSKINEQISNLAVKPIMKVLENNLIVGFITNGNQFVEINPFIQNETEIINLPSIESNNINNLNKHLLFNNESDKERETYVNSLKIENEMYIDFRNLIRNLLNSYKFIKERKKIEEILDSQQVLYDKITEICKIIKNMTKDMIIFETMNSIEIENYIENMSILITNNNKIYNKINIINGLDNSVVYFNKLADELIRFKKIRQYLLDPMEILPLNRDYNINNNELLIMMSMLTKEYLDELEPYKKNQYIQNNSYYTAQPIEHFNYKNSFNQFQIKKGDSDINIEIEQIIDNIGKIPGKLNDDFPKDYKFISLKNLLDSNYKLLIFLNYLTSNKIINIDDIKSLLVQEYIKFNLTNVLKFWLLDGKKKYVKEIINNSSDISTTVLSPYYYLSLFDFWIISRKLNIPIIAYSATYFPQTNESFIKLNENKGNYIYMLKFAGTKNNDPTNISIISQTHNISGVQISKFEGLNNLLSEINKIDYINDLNDFVNKYKLKKTIFKIEE